MELFSVFAALYSCSVFFMASLVVRFAPSSGTSRLLRRRIAWCMLLPLLLAVDLGKRLGDSINYFSLAIRRLFEWLSGRKQYRRSPYSGMTRHKRRAQQRPLP